MVYELRTYVIPPGRMPDILERFATVTLRLFARHGMELVGFWTVCRPQDEHALVYLLRFADEGAQERAWAAFRVDPEWQETRRRTEASGPIVAQVIEKTLVPTAFSPLQ
ncbi:MAG: NIPSNAP family protein [Candidatus Latescibacterota bacterium]